MDVPRRVRGELRGKTTLFPRSTGRRGREPDRPFHTSPPSRGTVDLASWRVGTPATIRHNWSAPCPAAAAATRFSHGEMLAIFHCWRTLMDLATLSPAACIATRAAALLLTLVATTASADTREHGAIRSGTLVFAV